MRRVLILVSLTACLEPAPPQDHAETGTPAPDPWQLATTAPFAAPVAPAIDETSCAVIEATRCEDGIHQTCAPLDVALGEFVDPPELLRRAWLFDRWYDLYHSPDGQTSDRESHVGFAPGTPESVWADPAAFREWDGFGDSAIWTGVATHSAMLRWLSTGTPADKDRFEAKVRHLLTQFEVTDADGYLARAHFLAVPDGSEPSPDHLTLTESQADDVIRFVARNTERAPDLPQAYLDGLPSDAGPIPGTVMWQGNPSIDQYTGPMTVLPAAWSLLDDPTLKQRIATQMVGYLHRLERIELTNLQSNPEIAEAATAVLAGTGSVDEDLDIEGLDTIVLYVLPAYNRHSADTYPSAAPADFPRGASARLDASESSFLLDLVGLLARLTKGAAEGIDHIYAPSVRGGDAVHMMHLAAMAWHMTGEDRYRDFLQQDLLEEIGTDRVANTFSALVLPPWCRSFYGDHITLPLAWALLNLLDGGPLEDELRRAITEEGWEKMAYDLGNAKFDLMVADHVDQDALASELRLEAQALLRDLGGNGGRLDDPRRTYTVTLDDVRGAYPELELRCPTEEERDLCEGGFSALGLTVPGEDISTTCTGTELDCDLGDGRCAEAIAGRWLPPSVRTWQDFAWQRNPFEIGAQYSVEGTKSSPGLDLTESYWLARTRGVETDGSTFVLAWRDDGTCSP